ncbi:toxic anion resistance protein [Frigidibacter oleivorans]|uniref:toxic anion resistance protein n=1 Tax=Frigidibacter oleivorans TaxID=2487129 RepID=UPI000F8E8B01|nr:toxic anion resistance protein [Frigidibacter oleivorans]
MTETTRQQAAAEYAEVERIASVALPDPDDAVVPLSEAPAAMAEDIRKAMAEIDLADTGSIVGFGAAAQSELQEISQSMLADVKNKDVGPAGDSLREIVTTIRGFSVSELDVRRKSSWWERLLGRSAPFARFVARYEEVQGQIDRVTDTLLGHEHRLLKDIKSLDLLYEKTLDFYDGLAIYIAAGEEKLRETDMVAIPAKEAEVNAAPEDQRVLKAQELRDLRGARDDLERRVHDLKLTRQVTMQSLPSIRLVQENDKALVTKISSTLVNTVPLWETQLAQAVTIQRSAEAAAAVKEASDLTNELLTANAKTLRQANQTVRQQIERGVFDIEAVRAANAELIGTIEDTLKIADEGKTRRAAAESDLRKMEAELRDALSAPRARAAAAAATGAAPSRSGPAA